MKPPRPAAMRRHTAHRLILTVSVAGLAACQGLAGGSASEPAMTAHQVSVAPELMNPVRARISGLPALAPAVGPPGNPYRGRVDVLSTGEAIFDLACARCHGQGAVPTPEAPDLRRLNAACRRLQDRALSSRCQDDVDAYFMESVRWGKLRAGVSYMPAWEEALTAPAIWALRTYIESRPAPGASVLPPLGLGVQ